MKILRAECYGLVFDDIISHDDVEGESESDERRAVVLESQVCSAHFDLLPIEVINQDTYRGDQAHDKCGIKDCFSDSYAQVYLR